MSNHFTIIGRLGGDPELRFTAQGAAVCNGSIADSPRRMNPQTGQWEDAGEPLWVRFTLWNSAAEAFAETAQRGDRVVAVGHLKARSYEKDGQKRVAVELDARSVAVLPKSRPADRQQATSSDPWARGGDPSQGAGGWTQAATDEPPF